MLKDFVGAQLKAARLRQGLTLADAAVELEVGTSTVFRLEGGKLKKVPLELVLRYASLLKLRPESLLPRSAGRKRKAG